MDDEHQTMKTYVGGGFWLNALLTSALVDVSDELQASTGRFTTGAKAPPPPLLNKGLAGPQSMFGCHGVNKSLPQSGVELWHTYVFPRRVLSHHLRCITL